MQGSGQCEAAEASRSAGGTIASRKTAGSDELLRTSGRLCGSCSTWGGRPGCLCVGRADDRSTAGIRKALSTFRVQKLCTMVLCKNLLKLVWVTAGARVTDREKCESKGDTVWATARARVTDGAARGGGVFLMVSLTVTILLLGSSLTVAI